MASIDPESWPLPPSGLSFSFQPVTKASSAKIGLAQVLDFTKFKYSYLRQEHKAVKDILAAIEEDLFCHKPIHNWDESLCPDLVKSLVLFAKAELVQTNVDRADYVVNFHTVQEIITINGNNSRRYIPYTQSDITCQLFPSFLPASTTTSYQDGKPGPLISHGHIVEIKENISDLDRAVLLLLHSFCLRLQNEDVTFIRNFVNRHILLRPAYQGPNLFQATTPSVETTLCYKRLTFSFHLPHVILQAASTSRPVAKEGDRTFIEHFRPNGEPVESTNAPWLCKASSSVLLTLFLPEEQPSRREEQCLLGTPHCQWTVIVVSGSCRAALGSNFEPAEYQTPLSQFLRGICGTITSQRINLLPIVQELKEQLRLCANDSIFDDSQFTKSRTYHWVIRVCRDLEASIYTGIAFVHEFKAGQLPRLMEKAHPYEEPGLEFWSVRLQEEINELQRVRLEIHDFREQVTEMRDELHGASALLESRIAVMQSDRLKTLTYLSLAYLPLGTVSSIYSMAILPAKADLPSYFVVLAIFVILTFFLAFHLQTRAPSYMLRPIRPTTQLKPRFDKERVKKVGETVLAFLARVFTLVKRLSAHMYSFLFITVHKDAKRFSPHPILFPFVYIAALVFELLVLLCSLGGYIFFELATKELLYDLNLLSRPYATLLVIPTFSYAKFFMDIFRFALLPVWLTIGVVNLGLFSFGRVICWLWLLGTCCFR